jgi:hypothetical protein
MAGKKETLPIINVVDRHTKEVSFWSEPLRREGVNKELKNDTLLNRDHYSDFQPGVDPYPQRKTGSARPSGGAHAREPQDQTLAWGIPKGWAIASSQ